MYIKNDMDFNDLMKNCWSGAVDTLHTIEENDKEDELMVHLAEVFETDFENVPTMTEVNDYLWFEDEAIFEALGISEDDDEEEEEDGEPLHYTEGVTEKSMINVDDMCNRYGLSGCEACPYGNVKSCLEHFEKMKNR